MRSYLKQFLDTCETVIDASDGGSRDLRFATVRIAMLKAYLLLSADSITVAGPAKRNRADGEDYGADLRRFVEQVVSARSLIFRLLDDYDPDLSKAVRENCERKSMRTRGYARTRVSVRVIIALAGALLLLVVILFTVFQLFIH